MVLAKKITANQQIECMQSAKCIILLLSSGQVIALWLEKSIKLHRYTTGFQLFVCVRVCLCQCACVALWQTATNDNKSVWHVNAVNDKITTALLAKL